MTTGAAVAGAPWTLLAGDALGHLRTLPDAAFDLVYLDPPFATGRARRGAGGAFADPAIDLAESLRPSVLEIRRVLRPTGAILLHCDWRTCHRLRVLLDEVFGADHLINHLIWSYGLGGSAPDRFARKHDDILYYAAGAEHWFDPPRIPARSRRLAGHTKKATDVLDIPAINNMAHERTGWPTQKPLALLRLLVQACCPPGGAVLDPFCGSGTTLVAAVERGSSATGIDLSRAALRIARRRLVGLAGA